MDFQQLLNLLKGNLGGQGMQQAEDGSMVGGGYEEAPPQQTMQAPLNMQQILQQLLGQ